MLRSPARDDEEGRERTSTRRDSAPTKRVVRRGTKRIAREDPATDAVAAVPQGIVIDLAPAATPAAKRRRGAALARDAEVRAEIAAMERWRASVDEALLRPSAGDGAARLEAVRARLRARDRDRREAQAEAERARAWL